ncbi:MAG: hypothetical protein JRD89_04035 [Deltaproteobacteria bacterium]|nr:hypothetical protein [Deltaproteobacteria bacterium]
MMPVETKDAVKWALSQTYIDEFGRKMQITKQINQELVDKVREYFNENGVEYNSFSYKDLEPFLN